NRASIRRPTLRTSPTWCYAPGVVDPKPQASRVSELDAGALQLIVVTPEGLTQMLLQRSQTSSGMTPKCMSTANALHPRHSANTDSRAAATRMSPTKTSASAVSPNPNCAITAATDKVAPIPWAKRFGGPATSLGANGSLGVTTRVTNWPSG